MTILRRAYFWGDDGELAASIDGETAAKADAVKAARTTEPDPEQFEILDGGDIAKIDAIYREGRPDGPH